MPPIRILQLEDDAFDAELVTSLLEKDGIEFDAVLVDTREDFVAAIEGEAFDLILADYSLPAFDGLAALDIVNKRLPDVPFILVSGTLGEEVAIESLKAGATDYVLKHNLSRLAPSVRRSLREAEVLAEGRKTVAELRMSEERYRSLFDDAMDMIHIVDSEGRIIDANPAELERLGYTRDELMGRPLLEIIHPDERETTRSNMKEAFEGEAIQMYETALVTRDGTMVEVEVSVSPQYEDDRAVCVRAILRDITERRALEQQLAQAQKLEALGQLAGGIAHDFNNLLMSISGSAKLLGFRFSENGAETQELVTIRETVERGAGLTRRLLAIARQQVLKIEVLDLSAVVEDELKILRWLIPESIEIDLRLAEGLPVVGADSGQLGQVLMNLMVNARDAMPDGGAITVTTRGAVVDDDTTLNRPGVRAGAYVCLSVNDTGVGMDAETLTHIFEPFFTTKVESEGTGMGLPTVYGIVRQHEGFIEVESAPGEGTRFEVFLPVATGPADKKSSSGEHDALSGDEKVLVVEDEAAVRAAVAGMLEALGYTVVEAADGEEALELLEGGTAIDLVVSDVVMPKMGGRELLEGARKLTPQVPFLFSSGYTNEKLRDLLETEEQTSFIAKPYTMERLSRAVRQALGGRG